MNDTLPHLPRRERAWPARSRRASPLRHGLLLPALVALAAWSVTGCGSAQEHGARGGAAAIEVETVVLDSSATGALILPGRIKAREEVVLGARAAGRVTDLPAHEGDAVETGEVLARFDAPESRRARAAAQRELEAATLGFEVARRQSARMDSLYAVGVAASHDRELAASARQSAEARLESARSALESLEAALVIRAPFDGVVARRYVDAGADASPGTPLLALRSTGGAEIVVPIPEAALPALERGRFAYQVGSGEWRPARLLRLEGMTDFSTRTRTARLLPGAGPSPEPGAFARVRLESPELPDPPLPLLPATSIVRRGALTGAYVIEDGHAVLRWLKLGRDQGDAVEVLSGLFPGERVARVAAGLSDGAAVKVRS